MDSTGLKFQGPGSWIQVRFGKKAKKRDHRKLSLLMEIGQCVEKCIYDWRLDSSKVGDVRAGRKMLPNLPQGTVSVAADPAYDAREFYTEVEQNGAEPIVKPRKGYSFRSLGHPARPRALRSMEKRPKRWKRLYNRRPILESGNYALKRRFGERLWSHGLWRQQKELGFRVLVYNANMVHRRSIRARLTGRVSPR